MRKHFLVAAVVVALSFAASAAAVGTAKWVGGTSGTFSTLSNWEFTDTSGAAMSFVAADFVNKSLNFDFSELSASATLTNDVSTNPMIKQAVFEVRDGVFQMRVKYCGLMIFLR